MGSSDGYSQYIISYNKGMKYKTLVMKQIDQHTYQYSMNAPLDNLSPILSFDEEILKVNFGNEL